MEISSQNLTLENYSLQLRESLNKTEKQVCWCIKKIKKLCSFLFDIIKKICKKIFCSKHKTYDIMTVSILKSGTDQVKRCVQQILKQGNPKKLTFDPNHLHFDHIHLDKITKKAKAAKHIIVNIASLKNTALLTLQWMERYEKSHSRAFSMDKNMNLRNEWDKVNKLRTSDVLNLFTLSHLLVHEKLQLIMQHTLKAQYVAFFEFYNKYQDKIILVTHESLVGHQGGQDPENETQKSTINTIAKALSIVLQTNQMQAISKKLQVDEDKEGKQTITLFDVLTNSTDKKVYNTTVDELTEHPNYPSNLQKELFSVENIYSVD